MPSLGSIVELTLVVWMLESRPTGHESRRSSPALGWASSGELALVAWVRESWPQRHEHKRVSQWYLSSRHSRKVALTPPARRGGELTLVVEVQESRAGLMT